MRGGHFLNADRVRGAHFLNATPRHFCVARHGILPTRASTQSVFRKISFLHSCILVLVTPVFGRLCKPAAQSCLVTGATRPDVFNMCGLPVPVAVHPASAFVCEAFGFVAAASTSPAPSRIACPIGLDVPSSAASSMLSSVRRFVRDRGRWGR